MTYTLTRPGQKPQIILAVPKYDFAWQLGYDAASPIRVTSGTRLHIDAHYDNSPNNPANPDATRAVYGGTQTWEEMMVPFFGVLVDAHADPNRVIDLPGQVGAIPALPALTGARRKKASLPHIEVEGELVSVWRIRSRLTLRPWRRLP